jgi:hypothetical protein
MQPSDMKYPLCWIAYFDLLGFRSLVENRSIWEVRKCYEEALDEVNRKCYWTPAMWFSDTFLFYTQDDSRDSFGKIVGASEGFFRRMLKNLIPVRGCLAFGEFYAGPKGTLFGPALIKAYDEAEAQDWLGFILSEEAENKVKQYEINGRSVYDNLREHYFREYDVPFKKVESQRGQEPRSIEYRRRLVYTINLGSPRHGSEDPESARLLWNDLDHMQAISHLAKNLDDEKRQSINRKYENTKAFLMDTVPKLSDYVRK